MFAINALLHNGTELQNIKEELLLNQLKLSREAQWIFPRILFLGAR